MGRGSWQLAILPNPLVTPPRGCNVGPRASCQGGPPRQSHREPGGQCLPLRPAALYPDPPGLPAGWVKRSGGPGRPLWESGEVHVPKRTSVSKRGRGPRAQRPSQRPHCWTVATQPVLPNSKIALGPPPPAPGTGGHPPPAPRSAEGTFLTHCLVWSTAPPPPLTTSRSPPSPRKRSRQRPPSLGGRRKRPEEATPPVTPLSQACRV